MKKLLLFVAFLFFSGCCAKCGNGCDLGCGYYIYGNNCKTNAMKSNV